MPENVVDPKTGLITQEQGLSFSSRIRNIESTPVPLLRDVSTSTGTNPNLRSSDLDNIKGYKSFGTGEAVQDALENEQSTPKALFNGLVSNVGGFALKLGNIPTVVGAGTVWLGRAALDDNYSLNAQTFTDVYNNSVTQWLSNTEHSLKEAMPVYGDFRYDSHNLLERMGTAKFWASDGFDGLAFLASAVTGAAGVARGIGAALGKTALKQSTKNLISFGIGTSINTINEAAVESKGSYDQIFDMMKELGYDDKVAKEKAANAAAGTFTKQAGFLLFSNAFEMRMFFGNPLNDYNKGISKILASNKSIADVKTWKNVVGSMFKGAAVEGFEENFQNAVNNYEAYKAFGLYDATKDIMGEQGVLKSLAQQVSRGFKTKEGQNSMVIGAILGMGGGVYSGYKDAKDERKKIEDAYSKQAEFTQLEKLGDKMYVNYLLKSHMTDDKGKILLDSNDDATDNPDFYRNRAAQIMTDKEMEAERINAIMNNDDIALAFTDSFYLSRKLFTYLANPLYENTNDAYEVMMKRLQDDISEYADVNSENKDEALSKLLNESKPFLDKLKKEYDNVSKKLDKVTTGDPVNDTYLRNRLQRMMYYNVSKIATLESLKSKVSDPEKIKDIDAIINSTKELNDLIVNKKSKESKEFYKSVVDELNKKVNFAKEINEIETKLKDPNIDAAESKRLNDEYAKKGLQSGIDKYINGYSQLDRLGSPIKLQEDPVELLNAEQPDPETPTQKGAHYWRVLGKKRSMDYFKGKNFEIIDDVNKQIDDTIDKINTANKPETEDLNYLVGISKALISLSNQTGVNITQADKDQIADKLKKVDQIVQDSLLSINSEYDDTYNELFNQLTDLGFDRNDPEDISFFDSLIKNPNGNISLSDVLTEGVEFDEVQEKLDILSDLYYQSTESEHHAKLTKEFIHNLTNIKINNDALLTDFDKSNLSEREELLLKDFLDNPESNYSVSGVFDEIELIAKFIDNDIETELDKIVDIPFYTSRLNKYKFLKAYLSENTYQTKYMSDTIDKINKIIEFHENVLIPLAAKNAERRGVLQKQVEEEDMIMRWNQVGISFDKDVNTGSYKINPTQISEKIRNIIGKDVFDGILKQAEEATLPLDIVFVERIINILRSKTADELKPLIEYLEENNKMIIEALEKIKYMSNGTEMSFVSDSLQMKGYKVNPRAYFIGVLQDFISVKSKSDPKYYNSPLYLFYKHGLITKLERDIESQKNIDGNIPYDVFSDLLFLHKSLVINTELQNNLKHKPLFLDFNTKLKELNQKEKFSLNNEQQLSLREMFNWISIDNPKVYGYLKGVAGSGKTTVVTKYLLGMIGLNKDSIIATAHNESATKTINDAIGNVVSSAPILTQILADENSLNGKTLLIIDEINANDQAVYNRLINVIERINKARELKKETPIKVLMLGDPYQIKKDVSVNFDEFIAEKNNGALDVFPPLTIPYRSDIGAINRLANAFQNTIIDVKNVALSLSSDILDKEAIGTTTISSRRNSDNTLVDVISRLSHVKDNGRSKVIIVGNENQVDAYQNQLNAVGDITTEVLTIYDAQGKTFDEVFVDINKDEFVKTTNDKQVELESRLKYNTLMYTALSRAAKYLAVHDETKTFTDNVDKTNLYENQEALEQEKAGLKASVDFKTEFRIKELGGVIPVTTLLPTPPEDPTDPVEVETIEEEELEEEMEIDEEQPGSAVDPDPNETEESQENLPPIGDIIDDIVEEVDDSIHIIAAPTESLITKSINKAKDFFNRVISIVDPYNDKRTKESVIPNATVGTDVVYVKAKRGTGTEARDVVLVLSKRTAVENDKPILNGSPFYDIMSVIYSENINLQNNAFGKKLLDKYNNTKAVFSISNTTTEVSEAELNKYKNTILHEGKIEFAQEMSFKYSNDVQKTGEGLFKYIEDKIIPLLIKKHLIALPADTPDNKYGELEKVEVKIFSKTELQELNKEKSTRTPLTERDSGFPYVVATIKIKNGGSKKLFIRMNPRNLNSQDTFINPLVTFSSSVNKIEGEAEAIGFKNFKWNLHPAFNKLVNLYKNNYYAEPDGKDERDRPKYKISKLDKPVVELEQLQTAIGKYYPDATKEQFEKLHQIFTGTVFNDLVNVAFSAKQNAVKTSAKGYVTFLEKQASLGLVSEEDVAAYRDWIKSLEDVMQVANGDLKLIANVSKFIGTDIGEKIEAPFTVQEIDILLNKTKLATHLIMREYANENIAYDSLPVPDKDMPGFRGRTFFSFLNKKTGRMDKVNYLQYRVRTLRRMIGASSYIQIKEGPNKGKFFALDPLSGEVKIFDKILDRGFVSWQAAEQQGVAMQKEVIEVGLSKQKSPASSALYLLSRSNAKVNNKDLRLEFTKATGAKKQISIIPSLLSYKEERGIDMDVRLLSEFRKGFNLWYKQQYHTQDNNKSKDFTKRTFPIQLYGEDEAGNKYSLQVEDRNGLRDTSSVGMLKQTTKLEDEQNFRVLVEFMMENDIPLPDATPVTEELIEEFFDETKQRKIEPLSSQDLNDLIKLDSEGNSRTLRKPLDKTYIDKLSDDMNNKKLSEKERSQAKSELEGLLTTNLEKINPTKVNVRIKEKKDIIYSEIEALVKDGGTTEKSIDKYISKNGSRLLKATWKNDKEEVYKLMNAVRNKNNPAVEEEQVEPEPVKVDEPQNPVSEPITPEVENTEDSLDDDDEDGNQNEKIVGKPKC